MKERCRLILPVCMVVWVMVACAPEPQLRNPAYLPDTSIIDNTSPCDVPCWHDLTPGETPWFDAIRNISNDTERLRVVEQDIGQGIVNFSFQDGPQCCRLYSRDGQTLASISLLTTPQLTLAQIIEQYGNPQYIRGNAATHDQAFVSLVYTDVPMIVYVFASGLTTGELTPQSEIIGYVYLSREEMQVTLDNAEDFYDWTGYGALSEQFQGDPINVQRT